MTTATVPVPVPVRPRSRLSISGLMGLVAFLAAAFGAVRIPHNELRASAVFSLFVLLLLTATLGARLNRRPSWIGFASFGWAWLVLSFASLIGGRWDSSNARAPLPMPIPSIGLADLHAWALGTIPEASGHVAIIPNRQGGVSLTSYALVQSYHVASSFLVACLGALIGRGLGGTRPTLRGTGGAEGEGPSPEG